MTRLPTVVLAVLMTGSGSPLMGVGAVQAADDCPSVVQDFDAARRDGDLGTLVESYKTLQTAGCSEQVLYCAGNGVALAYVESGYAKADSGADLATVKRELTDGRTFGAPWQLLVGLADLSFAQARETKSGQVFTEAATYYQDAINTISEPAICPGDAGSPSDREIEAIHKRMTEAVLLAPQFEIVRTRAGGCGGIFLQSIRGFTPTYRPLPINFEFDKAEFTPAGQQAADQLLACLIEEAPAQVTLSGHTDAKGSAVYNMGLSERRLARVEKFLRDGGFEGKLVLIPKGEGEPFEADDPTQYDEDEIDQLNRRVTLRDTAE
jgi:outer membrane protein OmpA-like peptidoglycan-associated protein